MQLVACAKIWWKVAGTVVWRNNIKKKKGKLINLYAVSGLCQQQYEEPIFKTGQINAIFM